MSGSVNPLVFPVTPEVWATHPDFHGMLLRDWFAGQSINSLLITATGVKIDARIIAVGAYAIADAMLAQRAIEPVRDEQ